MTSERSSSVTSGGGRAGRQKVGELAEPGPVTSRHDTRPSARAELKELGEGNRRRRILVYGVTGCGKTTFARRLSERCVIPWHSVDELTWESNWVTVPEDEQRRRVRAICEGPEWILDTAYAKWIDIPLARADLIIALDYSRRISLMRLTWRCLRRLFDGKSVCNGNRETFRTLFSRDSIILWHFKSFARKRARMRRWQSDKALLVLLFGHPREAERWLRNADAPRLVWRHPN